MDFSHCRAAPFAAAGDHLEINNSFDAEDDADSAVGTLRIEWEQYGVRCSQSVLVRIDDLRIVRRAEFFFTLSGKHDIDRQRAVDSDDRFECIQKRSLRSLLIRRTARHDDFAEFVIDHLGVKRRAIPILRVDRLYVVHEINDECLVGTGIVVAPDTRVTIGRDDFGFRKTNILKILAQELRHLRDADILR